MHVYGCGPVSIFRKRSTVFVIKLITSDPKLLLAFSRRCPCCRRRRRRRRLRVLFCSGNFTSSLSDLHLY